ncbi:hypothetical protein V7147_09275 [Bacillus sp. JJ1521]|uniref:hypothetical protein n=1 Tax=Bacillus sp. JJ1521 TaxID=3122957 RepID=UPI002FFF4932
MKWKNYGLWVSLASILYMVFKDLGMQIDLTAWETYVTAIIGFLAALGIISNPDKGKGFFDKIPSTPAEAITQVAEQLQNQNQSPLEQQGLPVQYPISPDNYLQYQEYPQHQTSDNQPQHYQNVQQDYSSVANFEQNEYQDYRLQPNNVLQNDAIPNVSANSQEIDPTRVEPEVNAQTEHYKEGSSVQEQTPDNNSFDRPSIHGMPAPPNEHM